MVMIESECRALLQHQHARASLCADLHASATAHKTPDFLSHAHCTVLKTIMEVFFEASIPATILQVCVRVCVCVSARMPAGCACMPARRWQGSATAATDLPDQHTHTHTCIPKVTEWLFKLTQRQTTSTSR